MTEPPRSVGARVPSIEARFVDLAWLEARAGAWDALMEAAVGSPPFHARPVVAAHREGELLPRSLAWLVATEGERLVGLLPLQRRGAWLGVRRVARGWLSPYMVASGPLVAADRLDAALDALLDGLAGTGLVALPTLPLHGRTGAALAGALRRRGWAQAVVGRFERAVLHRRADYAAYAAHLGRNRRKGLRRLRNRLREHGTLEVVSAVGGPDLAQATEDFLHLEASGWKGRRGTALASGPGTAAFARRLFGVAAGGPVGVRADTLRLDGRPVAVSLALLGGGTAFLLKTAYAEDMRRLAPGVVLEDEIVRLLHEERFCERLDSAAMPGTLLEELYPDREPHGDLVFSTGPVPGEAALARLAAWEERRRGLVRALKRLRR